MATAYTFESGTQGATLAKTDVTPNLTQVTYDTGGSVTYDSAMARQGSLGIKLVNPANGVAMFRMPSDASSATQAVSFEMVMPTSGTAQAVTFHQARYASGPVLKFGTDSTMSKITVVDAGGTTLGTSGVLTGSTTKFRIAYQMVVGSSTSNGQVTVNVYPSGSSTAAWTMSSTTANLNTNPIAAFDFGLLSTPTAAVTLGVDSVQNTANQTTAIGAYVTPVTATITVSPSTAQLPFTATAVVTPTGGSGSYNCTVDWGDGATTASSTGAGPFSLTHQYTDTTAFTNRTVKVTGSEA